MNEETVDLDLFGNDRAVYAPPPKEIEYPEPESKFCLPTEFKRDSQKLDAQDITIEWILGIPDRGDSMFTDISLGDIEEYALGYLKEFIPDIVLEDYGFNMVYDHQGKYCVIAWKKSELDFALIDLFEINHLDDSWLIELYYGGTVKNKRGWSLETSLASAVHLGDVHLDLSALADFNNGREYLIVRRTEILASHAIWYMPIEPLQWSCQVCA